MTMLPSDSTSLFIDPEGNLQSDPRSLMTLLGYGGEQQQEGGLRVTEPCVGRTTELLDGCELPCGSSSEKASKIAHVLIITDGLESAERSGRILEKFYSKGFKGLVHYSASQASSPVLTGEAIDVLEEEYELKPGTFGAGWYLENLDGAHQMIWETHHVVVATLRPIPTAGKTHLEDVFNVFAKRVVSDVVRGKQVVIVSSSITEHYFLLLHSLLQRAPAKLCRSILRERVCYVAPQTLAGDKRTDQAKTLDKTLGLAKSETGLVHKRTKAFTRTISHVQAVFEQDMKAALQASKRQKRKKRFAVVMLGSVSLLAGKFLSRK